LPPFLGSKSKPSEKPAEADCNPIKAIITNISVNRTVRRLEGNVGKYAVVGSVTVRGERWEAWVGVNPWDFFPWPQYSKYMPLRVTRSYSYPSACYFFVVKYFMGNLR
jgi:hypothetical protein